MRRRVPADKPSDESAQPFDQSAPDHGRMPARQSSSVWGQSHSPTLLRITVARLSRNRIALGGGIVVFLFAVLAIVGPYISPHDPLEIDLLRNHEAPTLQHPFGTDELGRDIFSRVIWGSRVSLVIAVVGVTIALVFGVAVGMTSALFTGILDSVLMRIMDVMLAFPTLLLAIMILGMLGPGLRSTIVAIGVSSIPTFARLARGSTLSEKERDYIEAARSIGASQLRVAMLHIAPNISAPLIVQSTLRMSTMILTAAGLSFIGLGVQPPTPEWGVMMSHGRAYMQESPHIIFFPGLAVIGIVLGFNLFGDGLRDALDPRIRT